MKRITTIAYFIALVILVFCPIFALVDNATSDLDDDNESTIMEAIEGFINQK